jgi:hypothetical protein
LIDPSFTRCIKIALPGLLLSYILSNVFPLKDSIKSVGEAAAVVAMWFVSKREMLNASYKMIGVGGDRKCTGQHTEVHCTV